MPWIHLSKVIVKAKHSSVYFLPYKRRFPSQSCSISLTQLPINALILAASSSIKCKRINIPWKSGNSSGHFFFFYLSHWNWGECCQFCFSQCSNFQEINYGLIIKKKKNNIHNLFALTVTSLLWRCEVSNLSGGSRATFHAGGVCVCGVSSGSCQACVSRLCSDICTHRHAHTLWSSPMPVTPKPPPLTASIYLLCKKTLSCINYWINYSNYDASA